MKPEGEIMIVWFKIIVPPALHYSQLKHLVAVAGGRVVSCSSVLLNPGAPWATERAKFEEWGWTVEEVPSP